MYLSLHKNKRDTYPIDTDDDHLITSSRESFNQEETEHLVRALRQHHLNRMWSIFQEFEWNIDMSSSDHLKSEDTCFTLRS